MSTASYKNIPQLSVTDYVCRNDGRACALLSGNVLIFEMDASLVSTSRLDKLSRYLRTLGMTAAYIIAWGYDSLGNYKDGYHRSLMLTTSIGAHTELASIPMPTGVAPGDTWYFAVHMGPFNKSLLKVVLETL